MRILIIVTLSKRCQQKGVNTNLAYRPGAHQCHLVATFEWLNLINALNALKIVLKWSTVCNMSKVASQNECVGAGGSWIILPFMCETGGLSVPCVYVLLSLTWCNGTCSNNSGGMASQRESLKTLRFAATLCLIWILLEREWLVSAVIPQTPDQFFSEVSETIKKTHHSCCHGD